jgi:hypothetical protein
MAVETAGGDPAESEDASGPNQSRIKVIPSGTECKGSLCATIER